MAPVGTFDNLDPLPAQVATTRSTRYTEWLASTVPFIPPPAFTILKLMGDTKKLPSYIYLPPDAVERQAELTRTGTYDLLPSEARWRERYDFLKKKGYRLRPRYHPKWKPSWTGTNLDPEFCEDSVMLLNPDVIDAVRERDGYLVAIKTVKKNGEELRLSQLLSSLKHPSNHCVSVIDVLEDSFNPTMSLMVMQYLRPWNDPELTMVGDVVDFVSQMLEGLAFLHSHRVAHRDIASLNVMMDGRSLYPEGHHPVWRGRSLDAIEDLVPLHRIDRSVKYFYVDFGLSVRFAPDAPTLVVGDVGRDAEVPELSSTVPYDPFKADIYALGNLFDKELAQKYHGLEFLRSLIDAMKRQQPSLRPTADELVALFQDTKKTLTPSSVRWRLGSKSEPAYERLLYDTVAVAKDSFSQLRRFVRPT